jgi:rhodanese-related sulfurtransferase
MPPILLRELSRAKRPRRTTMSTIVTHAGHAETENPRVSNVAAATHVAWATGTELTKNPRFLRELEAKLPKTAVGVLLCRSGKRSAPAAEAATRAGWAGVFNVDEGFEGDLDARQQRGSLGGWRYRGLPWAQD